MQLFSLLAATEDAAHSKSFLDALPHLAGMLVVLATLAFLWGICALTATIIKLLIGDKKSTASAPTTAPAAVVAAAPAPPVVAAPTTEPVVTRIAPEIVAVIAAAVASITGQQSVRIISIKPSNSSWERAGRQSVLTSHRIR